MGGAASEGRFALYRRERTLAERARRQVGGGASETEANGMGWSGGVRKSGRQGPGEGGGERGGAVSLMTLHDIS